MIWFVDASALVKRYVNETGSHWLRSELALHQVVIAEITAVELIAALTRRFRKGEIPKFELHQSRKRFPGSLGIAVQGPHILLSSYRVEPR